MINNLDINKFKNNSLRLIKTLTIASILSINITGCSFNNNVENNISDDVKEYTTLNVNLIGAENVEGDQDVVFGYVEDDTRNGIGIISEDRNKRTLNIGKGHFYASSIELGDYEFDIDNLNDTYTLTVNYDDNTYSFNR